MFPATTAIPSIVWVFESVMLAVVATRQEVENSRFKSDNFCPYSLVAFELKPSRSKIWSALLSASLVTSQPFITPGQKKD